MVKAAELTVEFLGDTRNLERASRRTQDLMRQNEIAILKTQNALNRVNKITTGDFGAKNARAAASSYHNLGGELSAFSPMLGRLAGSAGVAGGIAALAGGGGVAGGMIEKRCKSCNKLLFRSEGEPKVLIEIKCPRSRCGETNKFGAADAEHAARRG